MAEGLYDVGDNIETGDGAVWTVTDEFESLDSCTPGARWVKVEKTKAAPKRFIPGYYRAVYPGCFDSDEVLKWAFSPMAGSTWGGLPFEDAWKRVIVTDAEDD